MQIRLGQEYIMTLMEEKFHTCTAAISPWSGGSWISCPFNGVRATANCSCACETARCSCAREAERRRHDIPLCGAIGGDGCVTTRDGRFYGVPGSAHPHHAHPVLA